MSVGIYRRVQAVRPSVPQGHELQIIPILGPSSDQPAYAVLDRETLPRVRVTEVNEAGSVPELMVENRLDVRVFLMDGQELIGAKQNRILNTDVMVPAGRKLSIPVSCVEQGRWRPVSAQVSHGKSSHHRLRSAKATRVHQSLKNGAGHDADQTAVWQEVAACLAESAAASPTHALSDAYAKRERELGEFRRGLRLPEAAVGVAVFHGHRFR